MSIHVMHLIGGGEIGGAEQNVLNLLRSLDQKDIHAFLGCLINGSPFASLAQAEGIQTAVFPMRFALDLYPAQTIARYCRKNRINLLHCHGVRANLVGRLAAKLSSLPAISTVHSLPESDYLSARQGKTAAFVDNLTLPWSSGLITVSNQLNESISLNLKNKRLNLPVKTVYNGVPSLDFSDKDDLRANFRKKWGISDDVTVIGTIGRLHPVKGQLVLIEALKLLRQETDRLHLVIIGEGPLHDRLQELLGAYQISHTLTGYLPSAWQALPAMDLFVLPSLNEGMGLVLLEAAQAGVPIVASHVGGIPELLRNNIDALLTRPADPVDLTLAISKILGDRNFAGKLIANAQNRASAFSLDKMTTETSNFYQQILGNLFHANSWHI